MSLKQIDAILWRKYLGATSAAVWATNNSQYYFELPSGDYTQFAGKSRRSFIDKDGNQAFKITLEAFDGAPHASPHEVTFAQKRKGAARGGNWTVDSIREGISKAYELWHAKRGPIDQYERLPPAEKEKNYIVIVRDVDNHFHGRWIRGSDFDALPSAVREKLLSASFGWSPL